MSIEMPIVTEAESLVRELAEQLTVVRPNECLCCYVWRMLGDSPCNGTHRHAERYRDVRAPRATALRARLGRVGACCCDCEIFMNGYTLRAGRDVLEQVDAGLAQLPECAGVRRGTVQPCENWMRMTRGYWS
jgi:hypothetical protein